MPTLTQQTDLAQPPASVFAWHARPAAFARLTPPWEDIRVVERHGGLEAGARFELSMPFIGPLRTRWRGEHSWCEPPQGFTDVQTQGPFAAWEHRHRFYAHGDGTRMVDELRWTSPLGPLGGIADPLIVRPRLAGTFAWRHLRVKRDLRRHDEHPLPPSTIAMTGATGLVGRQLTAFLEAAGHTVVPLVRDRSQPGIFWDPLGGHIDPGLERCDAVIHLAGAPIAERAWTPAYKDAIRDSRVFGTRTLAEALARLPPKVLVSTSAIGFYGDPGDDAVDEEASAGQGFLAHVCEAWEAATAPAVAAGWRVATVRVGLVVSGLGGLLGPLLPLFRIGAGGPVGHGRQWMSWVHIDDLVALFHFLLATPHEGVFNGVAPEPVRNRDFGRALGAALRRPALIPAPAFAVRAVLGAERADALVLSGQRVLPTRALDCGFRFDEPALDGALRFELG